ncbi:MAG: PLP-dependent aminotransferase family protein, partial [Lentilitoribacter sp.]
MMNWQEIFASRTQSMKASEIRELLKLLEQPDIISFAGGIPDPALFPKEEFQSAFTEILGSEEADKGLQYSVSEG